MRLEPLGQLAAQDHLDRAVADGGNPRAIDPPPAAAVARRIAAYHPNRQSQRRGNTDHTHCRGRTRTRHPTAYSSLTKCPEDFPEPSSEVDVVAIVGTDVLHRVLRRSEQLPLL